MNDYQPIRPSALGPTLDPSGTWQFVVWAPLRKKVELHLQSERNRYLPMERDELGYHRAVADEATVGSRYFYRLDGGSERPDPASRFQPQGVHGLSEVVDPSGFPWTDDGWKAPSLEQSVFYELHVGTFTKDGTFAALVPHLDRLADLGVTTIELMPIAQFPGGRNWGYDGTYPYAVQNSYGGPQGLCRLVNAAHKHGLAVALDVVYNHLGPEGNYLAEFGPYFTDRSRTPWGPALNYDGPGSDPVRQFVLDNVRLWIEDYQFDGLRLDAVSAIVDTRPRHLVREIKDAVTEQSESLNRRLLLFPESAANDARIVRARE